MRKMNKKGIVERTIEILGYVLLFLIVFIISFLWVYNSQKSAAKNLGQIESCGVIGAGVGQCKPQCASGEQSFGKIGCATGNCCISTTSALKETMLPSSYGEGDSQYNFNIAYTGLYDFTLSNIGNCKFDNPPTNTALVCVDGSQVKIPMKVGITNIGQQSVDVRAMAVIIKNDDASTENDVQGDSTISVPTGTPSTTNPPEAKIDVVIKDVAGSTDDNYKIYPYVLCQSTGCKSADTKSRGLLRKVEGDQTFISVRFAKSLS